MSDVYRYIDQLLLYGDIYIFIKTDTTIFYFLILGIILMNMNS